jgi:KAP family P-loop domain
VDRGWREGLGAMSSVAVASNQCIIDYLEYYCNSEHPFDFAIMLNGTWGAGKTHFIKSFIRTYSSDRGDKAFLYISLYGVSSTSQIDDEIFKQLHPILSSPVVSFGTQIAKGLLRGALRIDLDKNDTLSFDLSTPDVKLKDYLGAAGKRILIFDDLERCSMNLIDVLGYINSFVEHQGHKIIILASEAEIIRQDKEDNKNNNLKYTQIKEKLIGRTFLVRPEVDAAIPEFTSLIQNDAVRNFVSTIEKEVKDVYVSSDKDNLRILKQSLWDFEYLANCFSEEQWRHSEVILIIFRVVLALSIEVRAGRVTRDQMPELQINRISRQLLKEKLTPSIVDIIFQRYPSVDFEQKYIQMEQLTSLLFDGHVDASAVKSNLDKSPPFAPQRSEPAWKRVCKLSTATDEEHSEAVAEVEQQFARHEFLIPGEVFQIFSLRLLLSEMGLIDKTKLVVVVECKKYVDWLAENQKLPENYVSQSAVVDWTFGWGGYAYVGLETAEFIELRLYFDNTIRAETNRHLPERAKELLEVMRNDDQKYFRMLCVNAVEEGPYWDVPVLAYLDPALFVDVVLALKPKSINTVFLAFRERYERHRHDTVLAKELEWLRTVRTDFDSKISGLGQLSKYRIGNMIKNNIDPIICA